jgi:GWxTD domain-containing protein
MRFKFIILVGLTSFYANGQALQDINYNYIYNPAVKVAMNIKPVRSSEGWLVLYELNFGEASNDDNRYTIQWEGRNALNDKQGVALQSDSLLIISANRAEDKIWGTVAFVKTATPKILVARVIDNLVKQAWIFYTHIIPDYPIIGYLTDSDDRPVFETFIQKNSSHNIVGGAPSQEQPWIVSFYSDDFPAAAPAFSEGQARVPSIIKVDSTFLTQQNATNDTTGLFLIQTDTTSREGFAYRVYDDYPRYTKLISLSDPLLYVCTKQEAERLKEARGDKKSFDRVILGITGNTDRAKDFMRSYFRRVELANQYFHSYKEGWKTDRGMIYIIFGLPDEVYKFTDREVWNYKNDLYKVTFDFVRSPTLFDPENYVLIRNKKFQETWYQVIDLWRNARF